MADVAQMTPKEKMAALNGAAYTGLFEAIADPIAQEVRNAEHERMYLYQYPVVPFMERGDVTFNLLTKLCKLSVSNGAIINAVTEFVLGGQLEVRRKKVEGFARLPGELPVSTEEVVAYTSWLSSWINPGALLKVMRQAFDNWMRYGNAYIEVVLSSVAGERHAKIYSHDADRCLYLATLSGMDRVLLVSPYWYRHTNYGDEPVAVPLYPNFSESADGTRRTMLHIKNDVSGREWYGEPIYLPALYYIYNEIQLGQYSSEAYASDFTGKVFMETYEGYGGGDGAEPPAENPNFDADGNYVAGPKGFYDQMLRFFTNRGSKKRSFIHRDAPADGKTTFVHEFKKNTDHEYHTATSRTAEGKVLQAHNWHPALMGISTPGKLGPSQEFKEAYLAKFKTVIKPRQELLADPINKALRIAAEWLGGDGVDLVQQYSIGLKNMYPELEAPGIQDAGQQAAAAIDESSALESNRQENGSE
jgi:hypothetical protein